ncbi:DUF2244 domain-containing protein [Limnobacter sp.]|uniref:DUF2244 domain-containing protein n=1 Tax=Limnobacter sp. TaxID=2003368 RepID=UPI0035191F06
MIPEGSSHMQYDDKNQTSAALPQRWVFKRNCALTPRQLLSWYLSLCALTLVIASGFAIMGFWIVLPFAGLELLLVGIAFVIYARHAADYEAIELRPGHLRLEWAHGSKLTEIEWPPQWTQLSYNGRYKAPLVISHRGQQVKMGKFIAEKDKSSLHLQIRAALARAAYSV